MISPHTLELFSSIADALWAAIIILLHFVKPELDPRTRMVSEYACGHRGWMMQLAFYSMAASCFALAAALWLTGFVAGPALLAISGLGFLGAGIFVTDPVTQDHRGLSPSGRLHIVFSFIAILFFPITGTVIGFSDGDTVATPIQIDLHAVSALPWAGLVAFVAGAAGARHRRVALGFWERVLILGYSLWPITVGLMLSLS